MQPAMPDGLAARWPLASMDLALTSACNLRCSYCYQGARSPALMPWGVATLAMAWLSQSPSLTRRLVLTGGEPLLAFPLLRRIVRGVRAAGPIGRGMPLEVLTNGTLLDGPKAAFLARHDVEVQVSMDGGDAAQSLRAGGTFAALDCLLARLRRDHPHWFGSRVSVAATLTPAGVPHLAASVGFLLGSGVQEIALSPAFGLPGTWRPADHEALERQFDRIVGLSVEHWRKTGRVPLVLFRQAADAAVEGSQPLCGIARGTKVAVDVDGETYACPPALPSLGAAATPLMRRLAKAMRVGNVADPRLPDGIPALAEALQSTGLFGPRAELGSSLGTCRACRHLGRCAICPVAIALAPERATPDCVPAFVCAFNQVALDACDRFLECHSGSPDRAAGIVGRRRVAADGLRDSPSQSGVHRHATPPTSQEAR